MKHRLYFFVCAAAVMLSLQIFAVKVYSQTDECGENKLEVIKNETLGIKDFNFKHAYGNYSKIFGSYRAIFINYDIADDSDFKSMGEGEVKIVIMIYNADLSPFSPGIYKLANESNPQQNLIAVGIYTDKGEQYAASYNGEDIGFVKISKVDEESLCGKVDIKDSKGMILKGKFNVENKK